MIGPLIIPFYLAIQSATLALTNLINGKATKRQTESNEEIAEKTREHAIHLEQLRQQFEEKRDGINRSLGATGIAYVPGELLKGTHPGLGTGHPVIIFDNMLYHNTSAKENNTVFNIMDSIYNAFKKQSKKHNPLVEAMSIRVGFTSDAQVLVFHNLELTNHPSLMIFGSFDGTNVVIKASYRGITDEQFYVESGRSRIKLFKTDTAELFRIPYSAIYRFIEQEGFSEAEKQESREYLQKLVDTIVSLILQVLIDSYYVINDSAYEPIGATRINELMEMKKWFENEPTNGEAGVKEWKVNRDNWTKSIDALVATLTENRKQLVAKSGAWSAKRRAQNKRKK